MTTGSMTIMAHMTSMIMVGSVRPSFFAFSLRFLSPGQKTPIRTLTMARGTALRSSHWVHHDWACPRLEHHTRNSVLANPREAYPAWSPERQIPLSKEEIEDIFLDLTQKFGFQRDSMRNMVSSSWFSLSHSRTDTAAHSSLIF